MGIDYLLLLWELLQDRPIGKNHVTLTPLECSGFLRDSLTPYAIWCSILIESLLLCCEEDVADA